MRAIGYRKSLPIEDDNSLVDIDLPRPSPQGRDLLVEVRAVSVNPVDTKVRMRAEPEAGDYKVLGWDAAGVVVETGPDVTGYAPGDQVFYAGDLTRPGTNAEFHLVDERIVGRKPNSLSFAEAAALPLTSITAWEGLFDRLKVKEPTAAGTNTLLVVGGAGGVGSIAIQIARQLTNLTIIATASRPASQEWTRTLGAHHVLDHSKPMAPQIADLGLAAPDFVYSTTHSEHHQEDIAALMAPQGRFLLIDDPETFAIRHFKQKSISIHWEFMFTRSMFQTGDIESQRDLLNKISKMVDGGKIRTTLSDTLGTISAENLRKAHRLIESQKTIGKLVLEGF